MFSWRALTRFTLFRAGTRLILSITLICLCIDSDCGHYDGYTADDFERLPKTLGSVKGKFLLSSYPGELLNRYCKKCGWHMGALSKSDREREKAVI